MEAEEEAYKDYTTGSVPLVAWLRLQGFEPIKMASGHHEFVVWVFDDTDELRDEVRTFMAGQARVEPNGYSALIQETYSELRGRIQERRSAASG